LLDRANECLAHWGADVLRLHDLLQTSGIHGQGLGRALAREYRY
jgi:hypothetical protein